MEDEMAFNFIKVREACAAFNKYAYICKISEKICDPDNCPMDPAFKVIYDETKNYLINHLRNLLDAQ